MKFLRLFLTAILAMGFLTATAHADVLYSVRKGDTLKSIAAAHSVPADAIRKANPGMGQEVEIGKVIVLPTDDGPVADAEPLEDPILLAGVEAAPPAPTRIRIVGADEEEGLEEGDVLVIDRTGDRHRQPVLASRRGRIAHQLLGTARRYLGVPYMMGGTSSRAFDCSGFTMRVFQMHGISLPRTADVQFGAGQKVPRGQELPGDLVFFQTYLPGPSHVGIYVGNGSFIHASSSRGVVVDRLSDDYYRGKYLGARRVF